MIEEYVQLDELAKLAGTTVLNMYQIRSKGLYGVPEPDLRIGIVMLWKRAKGEAWARKYKARHR